MIRERVNASIARAKASGTHCGRPFIDTKLEGRIRDALAAPDRPGLHKISKQFGVNVSRRSPCDPPSSGGPARLLQEIARVDVGGNRASLSDLQVQGLEG